MALVVKNLPASAGDTRDTGIMAESCRCLVETTQYCKAIILQLTIDTFFLKKERHEFDPWVRKIPCREAWQPTSVFWLRERQRELSFVFCIFYTSKERLLKGY